MKFGLIGYPLTHSFSQKYFDAKFHSLSLSDFSYDNFPIEKIEDVLPILQSDVFGLNVTIPYKTSILDYIDELDDSASKIGAVNTIVRIGNSSWKGFNTDESGFKLSLKDWMQGHSMPANALILGTGGVSKAIHFALKSLGVQSSFISRGSHGDYTYENLTNELINNHLLIINATPLGMEPNIEKSPLIPYEALTPDHWLYDVVYNPANTLFLTRGAAMGAHVKNGLDMLHFQAEHAWFIWKSYGKF